MKTVTIYPPIDVPEGEFCGDCPESIRDVNLDSTCTAVESFRKCRPFKETLVSDWNGNILKCQPCLDAVRAAGKP